MSEAILNIEPPGASGDNLQAVARVGALSISIEEPWAGSTETGFGYRCSIDLAKEYAIQLRDFLLLHFPESEGDGDA